MPLGFLKYQLPPTSSEASNRSKGMPKSFSRLAMEMPEGPAPMMQQKGRVWSVMESSGG